MSGSNGKSKTFLTSDQRLIIAKMVKEDILEKGLVATDASIAAYVSKRTGLDIKAQTVNKIRHHVDEYIATGGKPLYTKATLDKREEEREATKERVRKFRAGRRQRKFDALADGTDPALNALTVTDRVVRVERILNYLCDQLGVDPEDIV